jgi:molecular chaperone GrpE
MPKKKIEHFDGDESQEQTVPQSEVNPHEEEAPQPASNVEHLTDLKHEVDEFREMAQRIQAEFQNYKKRSEDQAHDERTRYQGEVLKELLPVYENFRRASHHVPDELKDNEWVGGIKAIETQFEQVLGRMGLEPITTVGETFDPARHEAVAQDSVSDKKDHEILEEFESGYTLNGQVVKTAKVKVNSKGE